MCCLILERLLIVSPTRLSRTDVLVSKFQPHLFAIHADLQLPANCYQKSDIEWNFFPPTSCYFGCSPTLHPWSISMISATLFFPLALSSCCMLTIYYFLNPSSHDRTFFHGNINLISSWVADHEPPGSEPSENKIHVDFSFPLSFLLLPPML